MKIGEIKLDSLVIMNVANESKLVIENYWNYLNENKYKRYLSNMDFSINRAIDLLDAKELIPTKSVKLNDLNCQKYDGYVIVNLQQIEYFKSVSKVIDSKFDEKLFIILGDEIMIKCDNFDDLLIIYKQNIDVTNFGVDQELPIPNHLARIIPYYVKYDLYQEDEPNLAILSKNTFDFFVESLSKENNINSILIDSIYEV